MWTSALELSAKDVAAWLADGELDEEVGRWLARFLMFEWRSHGRRAEATSALPDAVGSDVLVAGVLQRILRLEDLRGAVFSKSVDKTKETLPKEAERWKRPEARQAPIVASVVARLVAGDLSGALEKVRQRMMALDVPIPKALIGSNEVEATRRLAASLLLPMKRGAIAALTRRWVRPGRVEDKTLDD